MAAAIRNPCASLRNYSAAGRAITAARSCAIGRPIGHRREDNMKIARRSVLQGVAASTVLPALATSAQAQAPNPRSARQMTLIKGCFVTTLDPAIGELDVGDVLIEGTTIADIG